MENKKACGIICEYNPFHNGHEYQIQYIKKTFGLPVVCAMSGSFVQRGVPACDDKIKRASCAVNGGADIVLEIPFPFSSMTAEKFAEAGVHILTNSGMCSHIAFGSECGEVSKLEAIADFLIAPETSKSIQVYQSNHPQSSYITARTAIISKALGKDFAEISGNPNDILAIEYIKAIKRSNSRLIPIAVRRTVERSDGSDGNCYASSSHIRTLIDAGKTEEAKKYVPAYTELPQMNETAAALNELIHLSMMTADLSKLKNICEVGGGTEYSVISAARTSECYDEMFDKLKCKSLTNSKIRRMLLFALFGVNKGLSLEKPMYTSVLAASDSENAKALLRLSRKERQMIVARRISEIKKDKSAKEQFELCENAEKLLCRLQKISVLKE